MARRLILPAADEIRFHQRGRHRQRAGDVVEPVRRVVGRQEFRGIHFQAEQIADHVRVFVAVQTMDARAASDSEA